MTEFCYHTYHIHYGFFPEIHIFKYQVIFIYQDFPAFCLVINPLQELRQTIIGNGNLVNLVFLDVSFKLVFSNSTIALEYLIFVIGISSNTIY